MPGPAGRHLIDRQAIEELSRLLGRQHRGLALRDDMLWTPNGGGRVVGHHLADHQPIEEHADGGETLLDGGRRVVCAELLNVGSDVEPLDGPQIPNAALLTPSEELRRGAGVGCTGVPISDVGGEELEETFDPASATSVGTGRVLAAEEGMERGSRLTATLSPSWGSSCTSTT